MYSKTTLCGHEICLKKKIWIIQGKNVSLTCTWGVSWLPYIGLQM